jgi:hypothetical protein
LSAEIPPAIEGIKKLDMLELLIDEAATAPTLQEFLRRMPPAGA